MKKLFKNLVTMTSMMSLTFMPMLVLAEDGADDATEKPAATFCLFIKDKTVDDFKRFGTMDEKMSEGQAKRDTVLAGLRAKMDDKRKQKSEDRDARFDAMVEKWELNAKNPDEKIAVAELKAELHDAIADRQGAVATIVADFRSDRDSLRADARADLDKAMETLQDKIAAALTEAQKDCDAGVSSVTVRAEFSVAVKAAMDEYKTARKAIMTDTKTEAKELYTERKTEMTEARTTFKTFFENFRARWQALFKARTELPDEE